MKIIADGGSTKIDWLVYGNGVVEMRCVTEGLNPSLLSPDEIFSSLRSVAEKYPVFTEVESVEFYGSGCTAVASEKMRCCISEAFTVSDVTVGSDMIGAARALYGREEGIACILGTGANSCLWDGNGIARQIPAMGYILGDEGSGAVLGRNLLNALYKGVLPLYLREDFEKRYSMDLQKVIERVYRIPNANKWLASLTPFLAEHIGEEEVERFVTENFLTFLKRNVIPYDRRDLAVSFVGSVAFYFNTQLRNAVECSGLIMGDIQKSPLDVFCKKLTKGI